MPDTIDRSYVIVMMGVSGSGKTQVGRAIARLTGWPFLEGDDLHPAANIVKMHHGEPLTDADRAGWLDAIAAWIEQTPQGVVSCSALKRGYRDRLRRAGADLRFVLLDPDESTLRLRLRKRAGHFMPPSLLDSQIATLERPAPEEGVLILPGDTIAGSCEAILAWLAAGGAPPL